MSALSHQWFDVDPIIASMFGRLAFVPLLGLFYLVFIRRSAVTTGELVVDCGRITGAKGFAVFSLSFFGFAAYFLIHGIDLAGQRHFVA